MGRSGEMAKMNRVGFALVEDSGGTYDGLFVPSLVGVVRRRHVVPESYNHGVASGLWTEKYSAWHPGVT